MKIILKWLATTSETRHRMLLFDFWCYPIGPMYGIYANIGGILMVNVTTWILWVCRLSGSVIVYVSPGNDQVHPGKLGGFVNIGCLSPKRKSNMDMDSVFFSEWLQWSFGRLSCSSWWLLAHVFRTSFSKLFWNMGLSDFFGWGTKDATFSTLEHHLPHYLMGHLKVYNRI